MIILTDTFIPEVFPNYCRVYIDQVSSLDVKHMFWKREWCSMVSDKNIPIFSTELGIPEEQFVKVKNIPTLGYKDYLVIGFIKREEVDWRVIRLL